MPPRTGRFALQRRVRSASSFEPQTLPDPSIHGCTEHRIVLVHGRHDRARSRAGAGRQARHARGREHRAGRDRRARRLHRSPDRHAPHERAGARVEPVADVRAAAARPECVRPGADADGPDRQEADPVAQGRRAASPRQQADRRRFRRRELPGARPDQVPDAAHGRRRRRRARQADGADRPHEQERRGGAQRILGRRPRLRRRRGAGRGDRRDERRRRRAGRALPAEDPDRRDQRRRVRHPLRAVREASIASASAWTASCARSRSRRSRSRRSSRRGSRSSRGSTSPRSACRRTAA